MAILLVDPLHTNSYDMDRINTLQLTVPGTNSVPCGMGRGTKLCKSIPFGLQLSILTRRQVGAEGLD